MIAHLLSVMCSELMLHIVYFLDIVLLGMLVQSLIEIERWQEFHHGYLAVPVIALGAWVATQFPVAGGAIVWGASYVLADDAVQHFVEWGDAIRGRPPRPDWTPIHWVGVWLILHVPLLRRWFA